MAPSVLIVGSGPAGLAAALTLSQHGVSVRLIEKNFEHHIGTRGHGIQPRTLELFKALGILPDILEHSIHAPQRRLHDGKTIIKTWDVIERTEPTPSTPYPTPRLMSQAVAESILRDHLARLGVTTELGTELIAIEQDDKSVTTHLVKHKKDGSPPEKEVLVTDWLIGTDGAKGVTRKLMGITFLGETMEKHGLFVSDAEIQGLDREYWHVWNTDVARLLLLPLGEAPFFSVVGGGSPDVMQRLADGTFEDFKAWFDDMVKDDDVKITSLLWKSHFRPSIRAAGTFSVGRVFIAGDAAHVHSPMGGQGLNTSVQDTYNLSWKLALVIKGLSPASLLATYENERLPVVKEMLNLSKNLHNATTAAKSHDTPESQTEAEAKAAMEKSGMRRDKSLRQLGLNYRWSEIVYDERKPPADANTEWNPYGVDGDVVHAGDRAPDAPALVSGNGTSTTLFDLFTPTAHTALIFPSSAPLDAEIVKALNNVQSSTSEHILDSYIIISPSSTIPAPSGISVYVDSEGHGRSAYDIDAAGQVAQGPVVVIVRPDGFVGAYATSAEGIRKYFSNILV